MSAKLSRPGAEQMVATNHEAIGGIADHGGKPFNCWPGVSALERKTAGRIVLVEWKRARLPCRRGDWLR
jgi:hypothetical protein